MLSGAKIVLWDAGNLHDASSLRKAMSMCQRYNVQHMPPQTVIAITRAPQTKQNLKMMNFDSPSAL